MEELISFQSNLLNQISDKWNRYLLRDLQTEEKLLGIKGLRGVGKTTLLLQYLKFIYPEKENGLYVTADHPYFYTHTLFDFAGEWYQHNGKLLLIDEVHKYPNWSRELKLIYDGYPDLQVIFTSSSATDLYRGESDLSRRLITQVLHGMSFREFLEYRYELSFQTFEFEEILNNHQQIADSILQKIRPLPLFSEYLSNGYFPFIHHKDDAAATRKIIQVINTILEVDLSYAQDYSAANIQKLKKLLGVIATSAPFEPNISKIAEKLGLGRNTVNQYLHHLSDAHLLRLVNRPGKGMTILQKPEKIYFENTCTAYAMESNPETGSIRETFFANQASNAGLNVQLAKNTDFLIDGKYEIEIGGKNKDGKQLQNTENGFLALDGIETGFGKKIPLWLFGFLY